MKALKQMTNTQLVKHIMDIGGRTGAMKQIVMMHVIRQGAAQIVKDEKAIMASEADAWNFIDKRAWIEAAKEIVEMLNEGDR
jgi:hypothetical protein